MKLLFDHNLSPRLVAALENLYPGFQHVRQLGMSSVGDDEIWTYARDHEMVLVSKDTDFYHRSMLLGHPPKVIWIRLGNCTTQEIIEVLRAGQVEVEDFAGDDKASFVAISWKTD